MPLVLRVVRALAAPPFARHPPTRLRLAPETVGGLLGLVALAAAVGNAVALAAVLATISHPGSLGGWLPTLATLGGSALGLGGDVCIALGGRALADRPRQGAERVVEGLLLALLATVVLGAAGGSIPFTVVYLVALVAVYVLVTVTAAQAGRRRVRAGDEAPPSPADADGWRDGARAPVPWILPPDPRQPAAWRPPGAASVSARAGRPPAVPPAEAAERSWGDGT